MKQILVAVTAVCAVLLTNVHAQAAACGTPGPNASFNELSAGCPGGPGEHGPTDRNPLWPGNGIGGPIDFPGVGNPHTPAIPEPSTWALLAVGTMLVGFQLRRKAKIQAHMRLK